MGTKTIGITDEVYERLASVKRDDESFTDTIDRLIDTATADWTGGFGRYSGEAGESLERIVERVQQDHAEGFAGDRQEGLTRAGFELDEAGNVTSTSPDDPE